MFDFFSKAKRDARRYQDGWNWAAGQLLAGMSIEEIEKWAEYGVDFDGANPYDAGIMAAARAWAAK